MADAVQIAAANGIPAIPVAAAPAGGVPPLPAGAVQIAGFVPSAPAPAGGSFTQADVDRLVAAGIAAGKGTAPAAVVPPAATPNAPTVTGASNDALLDAYSTSFLAIGPGVDMERALGVALQFGKPELVDMAYITEKGGAQAAQLAIIAKSIVERVQAQTEIGTKEIHALAGGTDNWNAASSIFDKAADPALKQVVATMLDSGNPTQRNAAAKMVVDYAKNGGFIATPAQMVQAGVAGGLPSQALDKAGFQDAIAKLNKQDRNYPAQFDALYAARVAGKQRGL